MELLLGMTQYRAELKRMGSGARLRDSDPGSAAH